MAICNDMISIIVPVYNMEKHLDRCLKSILHQTYTNLEVILVNDGSTDNSLQLMYHYAEQDHRVFVYSKENGGVSSARNLGLRMMRGKYCTFVDPDDYVSDKYVEQLYQALIDSKVLISICDRLMPSEREANRYGDDPGAIFTQISCMEDEIKVLNIENYAYFGQYNHLSVYCTLFDSTILNNLFFDEGIYISEDALFFIRAYLRCGKLAYIKSKLYCYIQYEMSAVHSNYTYKYWTSILAWQQICQLCTNGSPTLRNSAYAWYVMICAGQIMEIRNSDLSHKNEYRKKVKYLVREVRKYLWTIKYIPKEKRSLRIRIYATAILPRTTSFLLWHYYQWKKI